MTTLQMIAAIGMIGGFFMLLGLTPVEFTDGLFHWLIHRKSSLKDEIKKTTGRKKYSYLKREIMEAQDILELTGRGNRFSLICAASLGLFAAGAGIAIMMENYFLLPVLAFGFMLLPFWYVRLSAAHFKRNVAAELETALSIITTAYLRNEDIITAVAENVDYLNPPVQSVFADFLTRVRMIDPDVDAALRHIKHKIENEVYQEWCDALCACQHDRSLKSTLVPIINKLSDMRIVNAELELLLASPRREFIIMVMFVVGNIPIMWLLNESWYDTLMHTMIGQAILALCAGAIFLSAAAVIKLTRPIEYKR